MHTLAVRVRHALIVRVMIEMRMKLRWRDGEKGDACMKRRRREGGRKRRRVVIGGVRGVDPVARRGEVMMGDGLGVSEIGIRI